MLQTPRGSLKLEDVIPRKTAKSSDMKDRGWSILREVKQTLKSKVSLTEKIYILKVIKDLTKYKID